MALAPEIKPWMAGTIVRQRYASVSILLHWAMLLLITGALNVYSAEEMREPRAGEITGLRQVRPMGGLAQEHSAPDVSPFKKDKPMTRSITKFSKRIGRGGAH